MAAAQRRCRSSRAGPASPISITTMPNFLGQIGVYGNRGANFVLQNADVVIVLGSRLDNRQRSGNAKQFRDRRQGPSSSTSTRRSCGNIATTAMPRLRSTSQDLPEVLRQDRAPPLEQRVARVCRRDEGSLLRQARSARRPTSHRTLSPYDVVAGDQRMIERRRHRRRRHAALRSAGSIRSFNAQAAHSVHRGRQFADGIRASGGDRCQASARRNGRSSRFIGDGGFQLNLQELQTIRQYNLDIAIVVMNNHGYGIIKQFQDSYLESRYDASRDGYSFPDFGRIGDGLWPALRPHRASRADRRRSCSAAGRSSST